MSMPGGVRGGDREEPSYSIRHPGLARRVPTYEKKAPATPPQAVRQLRIIIEVIA
jgi:hypothetical protein